MSDRDRQGALAAAAGLVAISALYVTEPASLVFGFAVLGMLTIIASWQPVAVLALVAGALPLYHQPTQISDSALAPSELLLAALVSGTVIRTAVSRWPGATVQFREAASLAGGINRLDSTFGRVAGGALAVIAVVGILLLVQVDDPEARSAGLRELRWTILEPLIFTGLLLWHSRDHRDRVLIIGALLAGGLSVAIWGLTDALSGTGVSAGGVTRASGPFPHPNAFALYLLRPVALGAAYLILTRTRSLWLWSICAIGIAALVASYSRSAALGIVAGLVVLWPWLSARLRLFVAGGSAALAAVLLIAARDRAVGGSGQDSLALRGDIWRAGLSMIRDRPLTGYGPDQFLYVYSPRYVDPVAWAERFTSHGHNLIIDSWVRTGIIGAVCVVLALVFVSCAALGVARGVRHGPRDALQRAAVVALVASAAQGLVDNGYFVHDLAMSAWLLAWIAFAAPTAQDQKGALLHEDSRDRGSRPGRISPL